MTYSPLLEPAFETLVFVSGFLGDVAFLGAFLTIIALTDTFMVAWRLVEVTDERGAGL